MTREPSHSTNGHQCESLKMEKFKVVRSPRHVSELRGILEMIFMHAAHILGVRAFINTDKSWFRHGGLGKCFLLGC